MGRIHDQHTTAWGPRMLKRLACLALFVPLLLAYPCAAEKPKGPGRWLIEECLQVEPVWSGHRVGISLLTVGDRQYVAYYDADRQMTVASRQLDKCQWAYKKLPTKLGWDSHNSVTMSVDSDGNLHVSGNMHCVPLIYFRTTRPGDIGTLAPAKMVGKKESRCTYPQFLFDAAGRLVFIYRDGGSGNGCRYWNVYDKVAKTWSRLVDTPVLSGEKKMNAYYRGPVRDSKGVYHLMWVWRDTPDCATNHDLSYARTRDLKRWETSDGRLLSLPITIETAEIVDPVPAGGGMINSNQGLGFDAQGRVILSYHKFDAKGNTQVYNARLEEGGWKIYQTTDWSFRWDFHGGGSIGSEVSLGDVAVDRDGRLVQSMSNKRDGGGRFALDSKTLKIIGRAPATEPSLPSEIRRREIDFPGVAVRVEGDLALRYGLADRDDAVRYVMRRESRGSNRDRPFPGPVPPPSMLRVYKLRRP